MCQVRSISEDKVCLVDIWAKLKKTKAAFVINPISHEGIVYNTGDVVKMTEQGNLVFVGRRDFQINMRGYRIELGDIENALLHVPNIVDVCAEIQKDDSGEDTIVVFLCV